MSEAAFNEVGLERVAGGGRAIGIFGHYGQLNLGDEALIAAAIAGVRAARPGARLVAFSLDPIDTRQMHSLDAAAIRAGEWRTPVERPPPVGQDLAEKSGAGRGAIYRALVRVPGLRTAWHAVRRILNGVRAVLQELAFLPRNWRDLGHVDLLIVAGSNQLTDHFGGAWGFPYTVLKWTWMARLRGTRVAMLSVGAGPLEGWLAKRFILAALRSADFVSVRDPGSAQLLRAVGSTRELAVLPDLAFGLDIEAFAAGASRGATITEGGGPVVAVNVMPVHDPRYWPDADPALHRRYLEAMSGLLVDLLGQGYRPILFGTQPADEWVAEEILAALEQAGHDLSRAELVKLRTVPDLCRLYARSDAVVATRFHGVLIALRAAKPVLGICYYRKSRELLESFNLGRYAVDVADLEVADLGSRFRRMMSERDTIAQSARAGVDRRQRQLEAQYESVLVTAVDA